MSLLPIIQPDNPILRKKAIRVLNFTDPKFQRLIDDMVETMLDAPGVGLAAPQVSVSQRLLVARLPDDDEEDREEYGDMAGVLHVLVNPKIIKASRKLVKGVEGCLSIPDLVGEVERPDLVIITAQDRYGKDIRIKAQGWLARVLQHEIDHLDGILFIDRTDKVWKPEKEADKQAKD